MACNNQSVRARSAAAVAVLAMLMLTGCEGMFASGWGLNVSGQVGDGTAETTSVPVVVDTSGVLGGRTVTQISAGYSHSCALTSEGVVACWGSNTWGELGVPGVPQSLTPVRIVPPPLLERKVLTNVSAGYGTTCAVAADGTTSCWGWQGETDITGKIAAGTVVQVSVGRAHSCVLTSAGSAACWGTNTDGQLGDGTFISSTTPVAVTMTGVLSGKSLRQITAGDDHTCALATDGTAACWGSNAHGELGNNQTSASAVPVAVNTAGVLAGKTVRQISAGQDFTCAGVSDGSAACWGWNERGQLGNPAAVGMSAVPVTVDTSGPLAGDDVVAVTAGGWHACALHGDGQAACWGYQNMGQLGDGIDVATLPPNSFSAVPVPVVDSLQVPFQFLDAGGFHTSAINRQIAPSTYVPLAPERVLDTRQATPQRPAGPLAPGGRLTVDLSDVLPVGATSVSYNVTATGQTASGYIAVTPAGVTALTSTLNWTRAQQTIANGYITPVSGDRRLDLALTSTGSAHVVLDITGYFTPQDTAESTVLSSAVRRLFRFGDAEPPLNPGESLTVQLDSEDDPVPPSAAAINVTVTGTVGPGVVSVAAQRSVTTSTVNWSGPNQTVANAVITDVAPDGTFTVTNNGPTPARLVIDLTGTFAPVALGAEGARYYPVVPARTMDTRVDGGPLVAGQTRINTFPVPLDATALVVNSTVTGTVGTGYLAVTPLDIVVPFTSSVNWFASPSTVANGGVSATTGHATLVYVGGQNSSQYVFDVGGYFR